MKVEDYATVRQAMDAIGVTKQMIYRRLHGIDCHGGPGPHRAWVELGARQVGGIWLIPWRLVREYARERGR